MRTRPRPSTQVRAAHPHPAWRDHSDDGVRLARACRAIAAAGRGVGFSDLLAAGFSIAELIEHMPAAERLLGSTETHSHG